MKQIVAGGVAILSGIVLFGFTLVAAAVYSGIQMEYSGYITNLGLYGTALVEIGIFPLILSAILFVAGLAFWFNAIDDKWKARYFGTAEMEEGYKNEEKKIT